MSFRRISGLDHDGLRRIAHVSRDLDAVVMISVTRPG